jgi:GWxTD domain-containing protein
MGQQATSFTRLPIRSLRLALLGLAIAACAGGPSGRGGPPGADAPAAPRRGDLAAQSNVVQVLQNLGLLAGGLPLPFSGSVATLPGPAVDTTLAVVSLSFPTTSFSFVREGDRFRASYAVAVEMRQNGTVVARGETSDTVRVNAFKDTQRGDESVLYQQQLLVPPGTYTMAVLIRDGSSARSAVQERDITIPRFGGRPSTPIVALEVTPRNSPAVGPDLLANARSTMVLGRDTELPLYLEVRDSSPGGVPVTVSVRDDKGAALWQDSVVLPARGTLASAVVRIPVARLGVGIVQAAVWRPGRPDTVTQPVLVSFGDDLPVASFDEMIAYLRFFATSAQLNRLKNGTPQQRAEAWASFLAESDPISMTPQNEALRDYFMRIRVANERFREDGAVGWLTDRGQTYVALGEPDQIIDNNNQSTDLTIGQRGRLQAWVYTQLRIRLIYQDRSGFGRWQFFANSASEFQSVLQRTLAR